MERAEPYLGRFLSRFLVAVVPGIAASALAVFVLYALHLSQVPEPAERLVNIRSDDNLTAEERRELTRQMLKARRENPEVPVAVTPIARPAPPPATTSGVAETGPAPVAAPEPPKARPERTATAPVPRPARLRPEAPAPSQGVQGVQGAASPPQGTAAAALPSPAAAPGAPLSVVPPPAPNAALKLPPVNVNTTPPEQAEPEQRSFASNVFSSLSVFAGTAANATGNTVNWVIALPGKAISAGGRLFTGDSAPTNPPPAEAPPPKQNLL
jgi:hypothetical protein